MVLAGAIFAGFVGLGRVEAQAPDCDLPLPFQTVGSCFFPSTRALSAIITDDAKKAYFKAGYTKVVVGVRIKIKRPVATVLSRGDVSGLQDIAPQVGYPANLKITARGGDTPIEIGCSTDADIITQVALTDSAGKRIFGRTTTKVVVQGVFN